MDAAVRRGLTVPHLSSDEKYSAVLTEVQPPAANGQIGAVNGAVVVQLAAGRVICAETTFHSLPFHTYTST